ncbi:unnamed protein product, partial [Schistosoma margrebowiei]
TISLLGTKEQKAYYLPKLASGEFIGGFCLSEISSGNDIQALTSLAVLNETDDHYILNGHKTWVTNGAVADVFVVFARTLSSNVCNNSFLPLTKFGKIWINPNGDNGMYLNINLQNILVKSENHTVNTSFVKC